MTDIAGASKVFSGGVVTYETAAKTSVLGIEAGFIDDKGVVSQPVAEQMASSVRALYGADLGIGITGVAGPGPDEKGIEAGTVYVALASEDGTFCRSLGLAFNNRERVRTSAASHALDMIRRYLTGLPVTNKERYR